jgi:hypothetical protein
MKTYQMEVSKTETIDGQNKRVPVGSVTVYYPLLSEMGIAIEPSGEDKNGLPIYSDDRVMFVWDALMASVLANARNKLTKGTITLKDGNTIPDTVEQLIATAERSGEALKNRAACYTSLAAFLTAQGKPAAFVSGVINTAKNTAGIPLQSQQRREKLIAIVTEFSASLSEEDAARFERTLSTIVEQAQAEDDSGF